MLFSRLKFLKVSINGHHRWLPLVLSRHLLHTCMQTLEKLVYSLVASLLSVCSALGIVSKGLEVQHHHIMVSCYPTLPQ